MTRGAPSLVGRNDTEEFNHVYLKHVQPLTGGIQGGWSAGKFTQRFIPSVFPVKRARNVIHAGTR